MRVEVSREAGLLPKMYYPAADAALAMRVTVAGFLGIIARQMHYKKTRP